ncbi:SDR family oxidoreductase [Gleimia hominis]|uniref:SDR family oxidoreductase n=1 Tax=Gleimia hominis TaxID=595468 RepID=A0ABU3IBU7_9ACTO|nr:glucose 1-dehydrogenase [Gleimia hominis]MDT3766942.1 SDR family oxidoreductase [Gleimia hominis]
MMSEKLEGKVALISGAASGMGESHARRLAEEGAKVVLGDIADKEGQALAEEIGADKALFVHLNVADYDSWVSAVEETVKKFGSLDILVNNAGIFTRGNAVDATVEDWQKTIDIDLTGAFYGIKASVPAMREAGGGSIINISSIAGLVGFKNRLAYAAAKWGVHGMTKTSALDFGPDIIRVNSVHPGSVRTPLTAGLKRGFGQIPLGRDADVSEISNLIVFLASDDSAFISGANIAIDGGETAGNNLREDS